MLNMIAQIPGTGEDSLTLIIYCTSFASLLACFVVFSCVLLLKLKSKPHRLSRRKKRPCSPKREVLKFELAISLRNSHPF